MWTRKKETTCDELLEKHTFFSIICNVAAVKGKKTAEILQNELGK